MVEMLFGNQFEEYKGEDFSDLIGDQWMLCWCDCEVECDQCNCRGNE